MAARQYGVEVRAPNLESVDATTQATPINERFIAVGA